VTVTVNNSDVKLVLEKLDSVQLELLRLRAILLPEEEVSIDEKKKLEEARKEIAKGQKISLEDLVKELC
jgi:transcriptional/translational regulatory protein YebC/TACO1